MAKFTFDRKKIEKFKFEFEELSTLALTNLRGYVAISLKADLDLIRLLGTSPYDLNMEMLPHLLESVNDKTALSQATYELLQKDVLKKNPRINYGKLTKKQKAIASKKIALLMREGYPQTQAIAIGLKYGAAKRSKKNVSRR